MSVNVFERVVVVEDPGVWSDIRKVIFICGM